jgi:deazaflavin-dependent oxidoreductase (nitroreductase family)
MTAAQAAQRRRRRQAMIFRIVNVPMRRILGLPFRTPLSKNLMLLYLTGRRTGKSYRQPVSYVRHDDALLTPGGGKWKLNLDPDHPVRIRLGGRVMVVRPDLVADLDEVDQLLMIMAAANPAAMRFIPIPRREDGHSDREALARAVNNGFRIVRWHLAEPS